MITGEQLKEIRKNFGLRLRDVSRGTFISESAISNIEKNNRQPSMDTLETLLNFYGYEIDLNLVKKKSFNKKINFYKPKSVKEILELDKDDLVEYIFITQDDEVISRLCGIEESVLEKIALLDLREILSDSIKVMDNLSIYYKMNDMYSGVEQNVAKMIEYFSREIDKEKENLCFSRFKESVYYIDLGIVYDYENEEWDTYGEIKLYDKNMKEIGSCELCYEKNIFPEYCVMKECVFAWRNENIDNQELISSLTNPVQIKF